MDQSKVNPFVGNTETSAGGSPVSAPSNPAANQAPVKPATPSVPVNPYAPAGAPYAPGSNTPAPDFATPYSGGTYDSPNTAFSNDPAVPNTGSSAYTSFSPAPSQNQDIYIPSDSPEKPKLFTKKFIILASVGLVLIAGAVVAGVVIQNNKKSSGSKSQSSMVNTDYAKSFYKFSNYIVNGSDSTSELKGSYAGSMSYSLAEATLEQKDDNYLAKMKDLFNQFVNQYEKARNISLEKLISEVDSSDGGDTPDQNIGYSAIDYNVANLYKRVVFLEGVEKAKISEEDIVKAYTTGGIEAVENLFSSTYASLRATNYPGGNEYVTEKIEYGAYLARLLEIYNNAGCLKDGYDQKCATEIPLDQNGQNIYEIVEQLQDKAETFESEIVFYIINACWDIQGVFASGGNEI